MAPTAPQSKALMIQPEGRRPRGRPRNRWEDDVPRWYVDHNHSCILSLRRSFGTQTDDSAHLSSAIGLYRDVWIAAIASSRTSLATLTGVMCNTSQCELRSKRVNSGMLNVIRIVTYNTLPPPPVRVARLVLDCNGVFAIKAYCNSFRGDL